MTRGSGIEYLSLSSYIGERHEIVEKASLPSESRARGLTLWTIYDDPANPEGQSTMGRVGNETFGPYGNIHLDKIAMSESGAGRLMTGNASEDPRVQLNGRPSS